MPTHEETKEEIREHIEQQERCRAIHIRSTQHEVSIFGARFQPYVETFELTGHPEASIAYAWKLIQKTRSEEPRIIVKLHGPRIESSLDAICQWVVDYTKV